jgi:acyl-homoserine lactone acylase PvdQ
MLDKPKAKMILDAGNNGTPGHRHFQDMLPRWRTGDLIEFSVDKSEILNHVEEHFWIKSP